MSVDCLLDTNVLVYAVSSAAEDQAKKARALELISRSDFGLSVQVLQEFYVTVTRKVRVPLSADRAVALMEQYRVFPTAITDYPPIVSAVEVSLRYGTSYWDAAIADPGAEVFVEQSTRTGSSYDSSQLPGCQPSQCVTSAAGRRRGGPKLPSG